MENSNKKIFSVAKTGILLALLIVLQFSTKALGQLVTGSSVNMVLAISAIICGFFESICIAAVSPFIAFFLGIGPAFLPLTPCIALGNIIYVLIIKLITKILSKKNIFVNQIIAIIISSICKFITLYLLVVQFVCKAFVASLKTPQIKTFSTMFSIPQLVTALIGGFIACVITIALKKALKKN